MHIKHHTHAYVTTMYYFYVIAIYYCNHCFCVEPEKISNTQRRRIAASIKPRPSSARPPPPVMSRAPPPMISLPSTDIDNKTETDVVKAPPQERPLVKKSQNFQK